MIGWGPQGCFFCPFIAWGAAMSTEQGGPELGTGERGRETARGLWMGV